MDLSNYNRNQNIGLKKVFWMLSKLLKHKFNKIIFQNINKNG